MCKAEVSNSHVVCTNADVSLYVITELAEVMCGKPQDKAPIRVRTRGIPAGAGAMAAKRAKPTQRTKTRQDLIQTSRAVGWQDQKQKLLPRPEVETGVINPLLRMVY